VSNWRCSAGALIELGDTHVSHITLRSVEVPFTVHQPGAAAHDTSGWTTTGTWAAETAEAASKRRTKVRGQLGRARRAHASDERFLPRRPPYGRTSRPERLVIPGSPAAAALAELRAAAAVVPVPRLPPGISACGTDTRSGSPAQVAPPE
jgi:hypothetical protein